MLDPLGKSNGQEEDEKQMSEFLVFGLKRVYLFIENWVG